MGGSEGGRKERTNERTNERTKEGRKEKLASLIKEEARQLAFVLELSRI
jgi:hypothetical protein